MENTTYLNHRIEALENELKRVNKVIELKEGKFISSQKVVSELRKDVEYYRLKAEAAREDAQYWANEAAKFEVSCNLS